MVCCGRQENIEVFLVETNSSGEQVVRKSKKRGVGPKSKEVGYAWGKGMPPIGSEFLGSDFGSLAEVLKEGRTQVVGFGQKSR